MAGNGDGQSDAGPSLMAAKGKQTRPMGGGSQSQNNMSRSTPKGRMNNQSQMNRHDKNMEFISSDIDSDEDEDDDDDTQDNVNSNGEPDDDTDNNKGDGGDLDTFLTKNIPAMATAARVDEITKKRTYVTQTNQQWRADLKPLYKQLELMARKALLITCDKSLMQECIDYCFGQFDGIESRWIHDLAIRRFRVNCNSWKSRYLRSVKSYIQRLEDKEGMLVSVDSHKDLQTYFSKRFSVDMFYTVCGWIYSWIDLESSIKEHPEVKVWCAYVFTEICVCVKHHLNWQRAYNEGKEIKKTQWDWEFILRRFDNLFAGADDTWDNYKIQQLNWLHNASKANRITLTKDDKPVLQPKDDEYALKPDPSFLATLEYAPRSPIRTPPRQTQVVFDSPQNGRNSSRQNRSKNRPGAGTDNGKTAERKRRLERETDNHRNRSTQSKKRRENVSTTLPKGNRLDDNTDDRRLSHDFLMKENQRINALLKKRKYVSKNTGQKSMENDNIDEYDNDDDYIDNNINNGPNSEREDDVSEHTNNDNMEQSLGTVDGSTSFTIGAQS